MRRVGDGRWVMPKENPGVRIEPNFISDEEAVAIIAELEAAADAYGYTHDGDARAHVLAPDGSGDIEKTLDGVVNNTRVTGRLERPDLPQKLPPWGHGDAFDASALPPMLATVASRIATCGAFRVGKPRDATINVREHSFFRLDPHVDPEADGPDVFILGLESSVVLTFTPPDEQLTAAGLPKRRTDVKEVGLKSWSERDVDVLFQPKSLVHFTGPARTSWGHAIRAGVQVDGAGPDGKSAATCDWWGATDYLIRRSPRRLSLVLAFGEPPAAEDGT